MTELNKIKKVAKTAVKKAGAMALREYESFDRKKVKEKKHHELITKVDLASNKIICDAVKKSFPLHSILSEETGSSKGVADYLWIIDPIDGTTNFTMHNPLWSISVGIAYKGKIVLGLVYAPYLDELYIAEKGKGAILNNKPIKVSQVYTGKVLNAFCSGRERAHVKKAVEYFSYQRMHGGSCYLLGSAALELAYVACGRLESMTIPGANAWDVAAGSLLVREAGGKVTDFSGKPWTLKSKDMLASNGKVHNDILKII